MRFPGVLRCSGGLAIVLAAMLFAGPGCAGVKTSDRSLEFVDPDEAEVLVAGRRKILGGQEEGAVLVDPRPSAAFEARHIPGALSVPYQDLTFLADDLRAFKTLIVYGEGYRDPRAEGMSKSLMELGFADVRTLRGGLRAWTDSGREVDGTGEPEG
jgi:rhodanese-related sulfurtransferase